MIFIKPNGKTKQYGNLKPISAIEPPVWLAAMATHFGNAEIIDAEVENLELSDIPRRIDQKERVIIFPTGSNAFGFFQQRQAARELKQYLLNEGFWDIEILEKMEVDPSDITINWDLLDMNLYRTPNWFAWGRKNNKYGATFTSLSCPYSCKFCSIQSFYPTKYKKRNVKLAVDDIVELFSLNGITNFKLMDEMFVFDKKHVTDFCQLLSTTGLEEYLNIWVYARIDTVTQELLELMKNSGITWVSYGIESGDESIRQSYGKGRFSNSKIRDVVRMTHDTGLHIIGNYMFGFKNDNIRTMESTFKLAQELCCEYSNFYCYVNYAKKRVNSLEFAQYSPCFKPESTDYLMSSEVVKFRDNAFMEYYTNPVYLRIMRQKFGDKTVDNIKQMTKVKLVRNENY